MSPYMPLRRESLPQDTPDRMFCIQGPMESGMHGTAYDLPVSMLSNSVDEMEEGIGLLDLPQTVFTTLIDHLVRVSNAGAALRLTLVGC